MAKLDQIIHDIHNELGADMLFIDVVGTDGLSIAAERTQNLDTTAIAARFSLVEKLAIKVADKLHLGEVEDDLVSGPNGFILMHVLGDGSYFCLLGLAPEAPLGVARMVMKDYASALWDAIPR